jgi:hypothetical protein
MEYNKMFLFTQLYLLAATANVNSNNNLSSILLNSNSNNSGGEIDLIGILSKINFNKFFDMLFGLIDAPTWKIFLALIVFFMILISLCAVAYINKEIREHLANKRYEAAQTAQLKNIDQAENDLTAGYIRGENIMYNSQDWKIYVANLKLKTDVGYAIVLNKVTKENQDKVSTFYRDETLTPEKRATRIVNITKV